MRYLLRKLKSRMTGIVVTTEAAGKGDSQPPKGADQPGLLRQRYKAAGRDSPQLGVAPAQQRFTTRQPLPDVHDHRGSR